MVADRPNVLSVQAYESGPPVVTSPVDSGGQLVSIDGDTLASTKQEEWVTKRKTELITTKQIETRVKRQVVLEDGKVIDDSGPLVTTTTTEDTDKKESEHTEHLTQPDPELPGEGWVQIEQLPEEAVVKETNERKVTTHDEVEDILETEQIQHLGDMSNQGLVHAIRQGSDARRAILQGRNDNGRDLVPLTIQELDSLPKRIINQSKRHDRTTDIEDTKEVSRVKEDGNLVTEITRRLEHEEFHNEDIPDSDSDEFEHIENREGGHDYRHAKNEDLIEYVAVPKGGPLSRGVKVGEEAHVVSENIESSRHGDEDLWESVSERIRKLPKTDTLFQQVSNNNNNNPNNTNNKLNNITTTPLSRSDALTNKPLNIDQEEYTRKNETNRWLNSHFGSSSSSLNSEALSSPRSPLHTTPPQGIHVTMTSRSSPIHHPVNNNNQHHHHNGINNHNNTTTNNINNNSSPPPPPPPLPVNGVLGPKQPYRETINNKKNLSNGNSNGVHQVITNGNTVNSSSKSGKRITFSDAPPRSSPLPTKEELDLRHRHGNVIESLNSQFGTKSGRFGGWDEDPRPTPPPRSRKRNSRSNTPDHTANINQGNMNNHPRKYNFDVIPAELLNKNNDLGERKGYERREQSFGYNGPSISGRPLTRDSLEQGNLADSSYLTKHSDYYKTNETNNPAQTILYENGDAEVTQRKTIERREKNFTYEGPPQKQFHPKYIVGLPSSTMGRLKGVEHTGVVEENPDSALSRQSQTLPRRRFYFGDEEGSLTNQSISRRSGTPDGMARRGKELRFGVDDIDVSISNSYNNTNNRQHSSISNHTSDVRKGGSLNRSLSFTPRSLGREQRPSYPSASFNSPSPSPHFTQENKFSQQYKSNPHLLDSPDLLSPRLITNMSRSVRDVHNLSNNSSVNNYRNSYVSERNDNHFGSSSMTSKQQETNNISRSKRTFLDNVRKSSPELLYDNLGSKASSPSRSMTPTYGSPVRTFGNENRLSARPLNSPRALGGANSPMSDDYSETYRMSSSTPDNDYNKPKISTDTTSRFSRKTLRGVDGQPAGNLTSSETTTRTKSRYKESEVMYPNGRRVGSPANFRADFNQPQTTNDGSVIIPVRP